MNDHGNTKKMEEEMIGRFEKAYQEFGKFSGGLER